MKILLGLIIFGVSCLSAFQPLVNARLNTHISSPIWVSFLSFASGAVILFIIAFAVTGKFMTIETEGLKWWMFVSGAIGALYVTSSLIIVPHLGIATLVSMGLAGSLITAAILDHFGVLAISPNPITMQKVIGMSLLAIGAIITLKS